jgi:membrane dipeptidase
MNRKAFIYHSSLVLGATLLGCKTTTKATANKKAPSFDLHTHPGAFFYKGAKEYQGDEAFIARVKDMKTNGLDGAFFSVVADLPLLKLTDKGVVFNGTFKGDEGWLEFKKQLNILRNLLQKAEVKIALKAKELNRGNAVKAYLSCEGGDFLSGKIENVAKAYQEGIRSIQLVHYAPNDLGDLQTWKAKHKGLSSFGKEVVKEMNRLGMLIDVAHASIKTVKDVTDRTTAPIILSHSILKTGFKSPVAARAISVEHAKMVANTGGVIGMWPSGFSTSFDELVNHTFKMIDAIGIDHVGIGTDMDANFKPIIKDYTGFANWEAALLSKGLSKEEVGKVMGGNAQRVIAAVL